MFLSEGYENVNEEIGADPIYAMQIMQEATEEWNDICMKMIKLEHTAIMKEDAELLAEGAKEALHRFKNNVIVLGKKLIEYLERVRVQWSKLQASIATKILNPDKVRAVLAAVNYKNNAKIMLPADYDRCVKIVDEMSNVVDSIVKAIKTGKPGNLGKTGAEVGREVSGKSLVGYDETKNEAITRILKNTNFDEFEKEREVTIKEGTVKAALNFLKKRPVAIKNIEVMKRAVTEVQNAVIADMDKTDRPQAKNSLVILQSAFNKVIIKINKMTTYAVKICNAIKPNKETGVTSKDYNRGVENYRNMKGAYVEKNGGKKRALKEDSLLDMFE